VARLADRGVRRATVAPLLLFAAGHAKVDIPRMAEEAAGPLGVALTHAAPLAWHDKILELSAERFREAQLRLPACTPQQCALVMVGRGGSDAEAIFAMRRFAELRVERTPVGMMEVAFLAVAAPSAEEALQRVAAAGLPQVIVQPHLLFSGELIHGLRRLVASFAERYPKTKWLVADHLGPCPPVAAAIVERIRATNS
jgi:sirohydrochlorin cobaltochelatase